MQVNRAANPLVVLVKADREYLARLSRESDEEVRKARVRYQNTVQIADKLRNEYNEYTVRSNRWAQNGYPNSFTPPDRLRRTFFLKTDQDKLYVKPKLHVPWEYNARHRNVAPEPEPEVDDDDDDDVVVMGTVNTWKVRDDKARASVISLDSCVDQVFRELHL